MPRLIVRGPTGPAVHFRFDQDQITIGRGTANDLVIGDVAASRLHAEVRHADDAWIVEDRQSLNGTRINGRPLTGSHRLTPGDEFAIGETVVVFDGRVADAVSEAVARETTPLPWSARGGGKSSTDAGTVLVGRSPAIRKLLEMIDRLAVSASTVLVTGESGTGKEVVSRLLHLRSPRASGPYVTVNCPALPGTLLEAELFGVERGVATGVEARPGRLEVARGGSLLLDEVGDLEPSAQAKLLRALQEKTFERLGGRKEIPLDVRFIAATNHDLSADVAARSFRLDLYHRLNSLRLELPPLRDRAEDIPLLVEHFLGRIPGRTFTMSAEALAVLSGYAFPGNVRELGYLIERAALMATGGILRPDDLPDEVTNSRRRSTSGGGAEVSRVGTVESLYERIVRGGESFWSTVHEPYLRRQLSRDDLGALIERVYHDSGDSYKEMARLLRLDDAGYRKLLNFLNHHDLTVRRLARADQTT